MANLKISALAADTSPTSDDLVATVTDPAGTPASRKVTATNLITKAHGLSDGLVKVATGTMAVATANTDYATPNQDTTGKSAKTDALNSATTVVNVSSATAPTAGQALIATSSTAATWQTLGGGGDALTSGSLAQFAATTSLELKGVISDETGSGAVVFADTPTLVAPLLGTPTSGVATNLTGLPLTTGVTGTLGIGNGGTGQTTALPAFNALSPLTTQGDILYGGASGTGTRLGIGTALQVLRTNAGGTAPEWATNSSQISWDYVVASSGGDYTTLGACLAVATSGQTIFIRSGTYVESAINITTTDLTIIGENSRTSIISMGANALTLSGSGITLRDFSIQSTGGTITLSSANKMMSGMFISHSAGADKCNISGLNNTITGNIFVSTSSATLRQFNFTCTESTITGNIFLLTNCGSGTTGGAIEFSGVSTTVTGNYFDAGASAAPQRAIVGIGNSSAPATIMFASNTINGNGVCAGIKALGSGGSVTCSIIGNNLYSVTGSSIECSGPYVNISGNTIYSSNGAASSYGVYVNASNIIVTNNVIYGSGSPSVAGIFINSSIDNTVVTNNIIRQFVTGVTVNSSACDNTIVDGNQMIDCTNSVTDNGTGSNISDTNTANGVSMINAVKKHMYMKNTSGGTLAVGDLVVWKAVANANEFTTTATAGDDKVFGVLVESTANNAFGRVQTFGKNTVLKVNGTVAIAIGDPITTYTAAGIGAKAAAGDMVIGYALEAYAVADSAGVIDVLLRNPTLI